MAVSFALEVLNQTVQQEMVDYIELCAEYDRYSAYARHNPAVTAQKTRTETILEVRNLIARLEDEETHTFEDYEVRVSEEMANA